MKGALGGAGAGLLLALTFASAPAHAQLPEHFYVDDVECSYWATLGFETSSAVVNLAAQADLNRALQWLFDAPGRSLFVLGADGPRPADARMGRVRADAVTTFLHGNGAASGAVMAGDFSVLRTSRLQAGLRSSNVVLMSCEIAPLSP